MLSESTVLFATCRFSSVSQDEILSEYGGMSCICFNIPGVNLISHKVYKKFHFLHLPCSRSWMHV